jgi:hypothetical protein
VRPQDAAVLRACSYAPERNVRIRHWRTRKWRKGGMS